MKFEFVKDRMMMLDEEGKQMGFITFPALKKDLVNIERVWTALEYRGQGVAAQMMEALFVELERQDKRAVLTCPYAQKYMMKNPQWEHLLPKNIKFEKI